MSEPQDEEKWPDPQMPEPMPGYPDWRVTAWDVAHLIGHIVGKIALVIFLLAIGIVMLVTMVFIAGQLFVFLIKQYVGN